MNRTEIFSQYRPLLMSIAYRMLGSRADSEDAVQEAFLRYEATSEEPSSPKAFLATIVTRLCIDQLRSARAQRECYLGPWLPEPVVTEGTKVEMAESLTMAFLVLLESLTPVERAAFLLHEVFDYDYTEIAGMIGKTEASCRHMVHRAKERITSQFLKTAQNGDVAGLMALFADDAVMISDGGGKVRAALNPVRGPGAIARFVMGVLKKIESLSPTYSLTEINGQPAFVTSISGENISAAILDIQDGLVQKMFIVANPDKLRTI